MIGDIENVGTGNAAREAIAKARALRVTESTETTEITESPARAAIAEARRLRGQAGEVGGSASEPGLAGEVARSGVRGTIGLVGGTPAGLVGSVGGTALAAEDAIGRLADGGAAAKRNTRLASEIDALTAQIRAGDTEPQNTLGPLVGWDRNRGVSEQERADAAPIMQAIRDESQGPDLGAMVGVPTEDPDSTDVLRRKRDLAEAALKQAQAATFYNQSGPAAQLARVGVAGQKTVSEFAEAVAPRTPDEITSKREGLFGLPPAFNARNLLNSVVENGPQLVAQFIIARGGSGAASKIQRFAGSGVPLSAAGSFEENTTGLMEGGESTTDAAMKAGPASIIDAAGDYYLDKLGAAGIFADAKARAIAKKTLLSEVRSILGRTSAGAAKGFASEAPTEAIQEGKSALVKRATGADRREFSWTDLLTQMGVGGIVGGILGGGAGSIEGAFNADETEKPGPQVGGAPNQVGGVAGQPNDAGETPDLDLDMEEVVGDQGAPAGDQPRNVAGVEVLEQTEGDPESAHSFSSTQLDLPPEMADRVRAVGQTIPDEDLAENGREEEPHITVKYGLDTDDEAEVAAVLAGAHPITVAMGRTSVFETDGGDVVKVDVDGPELRALNAKIAEAVKNKDEHPEYKPHLTIAYVKKGAGKKYADDARFVGQTVTIDRLTFSDRNGRRTVFRLGAAPNAQASPASPADRGSPVAPTGPSNQGGSPQPVAQTGVPGTPGVAGATDPNGAGKPAVAPSNGGQPATVPGPAGGGSAAVIGSRWVGQDGRPMQIVMNGAGGGLIRFDDGMEIKTKDDASAFVLANFKPEYDKDADTLASMSLPDLVNLAQTNGVSVAQARPKIMEDLRKKGIKNAPPPAPPKAKKEPTIKGGKPVAGKKPEPTRLPVAGPTIQVVKPPEPTDKDKTDGPAAVLTTEPTERPKPVERKKGEVPDPPPMTRVVEGRKGMLRTANNREYSVTYRMVEANEITPTHDARMGFRRNEAGDPNERPYEDPTQAQDSRAKVRSIADSAKPDLLYSDTTSPTDGPPIADTKGRILGGNARSMGVQLAYHDGGSSAKDWREGARAAAEKFGMDPDAVDDFENPIIVRFLSEEDSGDPGAMSRILNENFTAGKTAVTEARSRAARLNPGAINQIIGLIGDYDTMQDALGNEKVALGIIQIMTKAGAWSEKDTSQFVNPETKALLPQGRLAIEDAMLGTIVTDIGALAELPAGVRQSLVKAAPGLIKIKEAMDRAESDVDFGAMLVGAIVAIRKAGKDGVQAAAYESLPVGDKEPIEVLTGYPRSNQMSHRIVTLGNLLSTLGPRQFAEKVNAASLEIRDAANGQVSMMLGRAPSVGEAFDMEMGVRFGRPSPKRVETGESEPASLKSVADGSKQNPASVPSERGGTGDELGIGGLVNPRQEGPFNQTLGPRPADASPPQGSAGNDRGSVPTAVGRAFRDGGQSGDGAAHGGDGNPADSALRAFEATSPEHMRMSTALSGMVAEGTLSADSAALIRELFMDARPEYIARIDFLSLRQLGVPGGPLRPGQATNEKGNGPPQRDAANKSRAQLRILRALENNSSIQRALAKGAIDLHPVAVFLEEWGHIAEALVLNAAQRDAMRTLYQSKTSAQWIEHFMAAGLDREGAQYAASNFHEFVAHEFVLYALGRGKLDARADGIMQRVMRTFTDLLRRLARRLGAIPPDLRPLYEAMRIGDVQMEGGKTSFGRSLPSNYKPLIVREVEDGRYAIFEQGSHSPISRAYSDRAVAEKVANYANSVRMEEAKTGKAKWRETSEFGAENARLERERTSEAEKDTETGSLFGRALPDDIRPETTARGTTHQAKHVVEGFMAPTFAYRVLNDVDAGAGNKVVASTIYQRKIPGYHPAFRVSVVERPNGERYVVIENGSEESGDGSGADTRFSRIQDVGDKRPLQPVSAVATELFDRAARSAPQKPDEQGSLFGRAIDAQNQDELGFFSRLGRWVGDKMRGPMHPDQLRKALANAGLPADEIKWTGIDAWLADQKQPVKPDVVKKWLSENRVVLKEVVKGGTTKDRRLADAVGRRDAAHQKADRIMSRFDGRDAAMSNLVDAARFYNSGGPSALTNEEAFYKAVQPYSEDIQSKMRKAGLFDAFVELRAAWKEADAAQAASPRDNQTRFAQYTLPGGDNYREVLLTLPEPRIPIEYPTPLPTNVLPPGYHVSIDPVAKELPWSVIPDGQGHARPFAGTWPSEERAIAAAVDRLNQQAEANAEQDRRLSIEARTFRSSHFAERNIVAHMRIKDRVTPDGRKVLFLEEVQSDWHEAGRDRGYTGALRLADGLSLVRFRGDESWKTLVPGHDMLEQGDWVVMKDGAPAGLASFDGDTSEAEVIRTLAVIDEENVNPNRITTGSVPDAPWKKNWHEMVLRRAMRLAAQGGYDALGWTTGETQLDRYDGLAARIERVSWLPTSSGRSVMSLRAGQRGHDGHAGTEVPGAVRYVRAAAGGGALEWAVDESGMIVGAGGNLSEGVVGKTLSEAVGVALARRIMAEQAGEVQGADITIGGEGMRTFYDRDLPNYAKKYGKRWGVEPEDGRVIVIKETFPEAQDEESEDAHILPINEAMRQSVTEEGQPLFGRGLFDRPDDAKPVSGGTGSMFDTTSTESGIKAKGEKAAPRIKPSKSEAPKLDLSGGTGGTGSMFGPPADPFEKAAAKAKAENDAPSDRPGAITHPSRSLSDPDDPSLPPGDMAYLMGQSGDQLTLQGGSEPAKPVQKPLFETRPDIGSQLDADTAAAPRTEDTGTGALFSPEVVAAGKAVAESDLPDREKADLIERIGDNASEPEIVEKIVEEAEPKKTREPSEGPRTIKPEELTLNRVSNAARIGVEQASDRQLANAKNVLDTYQRAVRNVTLPKNEFYKVVADPSASGLTPKDPWLGQNVTLGLERIAEEQAKRKTAPKVEPAGKGESGENSVGQRRAKEGGEYGPNGVWYPGGSFIANSEETVKGEHGGKSSDNKPLVEAAKNGASDSSNKPANGKEATSGKEDQEKGRQEGLLSSNDTTAKPEGASLTAPSGEAATISLADQLGIIANAKLKVDKSTYRGKPSYAITGNTYPLRDVIKNLFADPRERRWDGTNKQWHFTKDPTEALAQALAKRGVGPDASVPATGRDGGEDVAIREARERELNRADERPTGDDALGAVGATTAELIRRGAKFGMPAEVLDSQIEDIGLIRKAYEANKPMFLVGSAPGSGKTYILAGSIRELREAGAKRFIWVTMNKTLIEQIKNDVGAFGLEGVEFATYAELSGAKSAKDDADETDDDGPIVQRTLDTAGSVLLLDEAHNVKNKTLRGAAAETMIKTATFTVFSSATPFENPVQAQYMEPTGLFKGVGGHTQWAILFGADTREIKTQFGGTETIAVWNNRKESAELAKGAKRWLEKQGMLSQRGLKLPPGMVEANFERYDASPEFVALYEKIQGAYDQAEREWKDAYGKSRDPKMTSIISMHRVGATKRILEAAKTPSVIQKVKDLVAKGLKVVVFVETKSERELGRFRESGKTKGKRYAYPQMLKMMDDHYAEKDAMRASGDFSYLKAPFSEAIMSIARAMWDAGLDGASLPSVTDDISKAFPDANVFTGQYSDAQARKHLDKWRKSSASLLLATMAKGGTGLSLHDKVGDSPTAMVILNMPWTATQLEQVSGRINRYGLASIARNFVLFANNIPFERALARRIGGRMRAMNATVKGIGSSSANVLDDFNFEDGFDAQTMILADEQAKRDGTTPEREIDIFEKAAALDKTRNQAPDKDLDFFATPYVLSALMARAAAPRGRVLEPSAGEGNLLRFLPDGTMVDVLEPHGGRLAKASGMANLLGLNAVGHPMRFEDWVSPNERYDVVVMNPPFSRIAGQGWQDITHVMRAYEMLADKGRLVAVMSEGPFFREDKQSTEFRAWLDGKDATVIRLPEGAFKDSGTGVRARIIVVDKGGPGGSGVLTLDSLDADSVRSIADDIPARDDEPTRHGRSFDDEGPLYGRAIPGEDSTDEEPIEVSAAERKWVDHISKDKGKRIAPKRFDVRAIYDSISSPARAVLPGLNAAFRTATGAIERLGAAGSALAKQVRDVVGRADERAGKAIDEIEQILKGFKTADRILVAKYMNGRREVLTTPARIQDAADAIRVVLDRDMNEARRLGVTRLLKSGKRVPLMGSGKAFPQSVNEAGRKFLALARKSQGTAPEVVAWADEEVTAGRARSAGEAVRRLLAFEDARMRGRNPYYEMTRVELPERFVEWDPAVVLPAHLHKSAAFVEGVRKWGVDFEDAYELIGKIGEEAGTGYRNLVGDYFRAHYGGGTRQITAIATGFGAISNAESVLKLGYSALSVLQNMGQRFSGTVRYEPAVLLEAALRYPPLVNGMIRSAKILERAARQAGALSQVSELTTPEAGAPLARLANSALAPFQAVERGNQTMAAVMGAIGIQRDIDLLLKSGGEKTRFGKIMGSLISLSGLHDTRGGRVRRVMRAGVSPVRLVEMLSGGPKLTVDEITTAMRAVVTQTQFPLNMATEPIWARAWAMSPALRLAMKFKNYSLRQSAFIVRDVVGEGVRGNFGPMIRFAVAMLITGELYSLARDLLLGDDESILSGLFGGRKQDAGEWAARVVSSFRKGGGLGIVADLTYGLGGFLGGPAVGTLENIGRLVNTAVVQPLGGAPFEPVAAMREFVAREVPVVRQAEGVLRLAGRATADGKQAAEFRALRNQARDFADHKRIGGIGGQMLEIGKRTVVGRTQYPSGPYSLSVRQAARLIDAGNAKGAGAYIAAAYRSASEDDAKEAFSTLKRMLLERSPLGPAAKKDLDSMLEQYGEAEASRIEALQDAWLELADEALAAVDDE